MTHQNAREASPSRRAAPRILLIVAASCLIVTGVGAQRRGTAPGTFGRQNSRQYHFQLLLTVAIALTSIHRPGRGRKARA